MTIEDLSARLEKVERANRSMKRWGGGLLTLLVAGVAMAASFPGETVTAKRFEVRDDANNLRAVLGLGSNGTGNLWLYDNSGNLVSQLGTTSSGTPGLWMTDSSGVERLRLLVTASNSSLRLFSSNGEQAAYLATQGGAYSGLGLLDPQDGSLRLHAEVTTEFLAKPTHTPPVLLRKKPKGEGLLSALRSDE